MLENAAPNYDEMSKVFQNMYDTELSHLDTFNEKVAQQIRDELIRCDNEAREYYRKQRELNKKNKE